MIFNMVGAAPNRPVGLITVDGVDYIFDGGSTVSIDGVFKYEPDSAQLNGWRIWVYKGGTLSFNFVSTLYPIIPCAVGHGADASGGGWNEESECWVGNSGGKGGEIITGSSFYMDSGDTFDITINNLKTGYSTILAKDGTNIVAARKGYGVSGGSGAWGSPFYYGNGHGNDGKYAFDDSTFDGLLYGASGQGGGANGESGNEMWNGKGWGNPGSGQDAWHGTKSIDGCVLLWCKGVEE